MPSAFTLACRGHLAALLILTFSATCLAQVSFRLDDMQGDAERLEQALKRRGSIDAVEMPLDEFVEKLGDQFGVPMLISAKKLEEAGIQADTPVTTRLASMPLGAILRHSLRDLELSFAIRHHAILITTPEDAESQLETKVYPVRDLVAYRVSSASGTNYAEDYDSLIEVITTTIAPHTWDEVGGPGSIDSFENAGLLVVSQTLDVHLAIEPLLVKLRQVKEIQGIPSPAAPQVAVEKGKKPATKRIAGRPTSAAPIRVIGSAAQSWQVPQVYSDE